MKVRPEHQCLTNILFLKNYTKLHTHPDKKTSKLLKRLNNIGDVVFVYNDNKLICYGTEAIEFFLVEAIHSAKEHTNFKILWDYDFSFVLLGFEMNLEVIAIDEMKLKKTLKYILQFLED